ncbi:HDOD domain-containing protein [Desulfopila sp. IMCC35006]|uniref:HDOD domain-containing protein n=1 Tax=Desulfopila sp. IMCC35006 TaxID=2569542 RepID=UPI00142ED89E|nr:HDOD domain-containing protein [Desulfopila sp. IMCC35006]
MDTRRHELIKQHIDSFPVLPVTVMRLMTVTSNPASSAQEVIDVILTDQSLCLTVLKISNSVLFGRPHRVDSIKTAVSILGFDEVQRIALAKALINSFSKVARQHKASIDKFWEHSFVCGMVARIMAKDLNISPDIAFMGGLIHDIGKLIMLETFAYDYALDWMLGLSTEQFHRDELHTFSFTHDRVGGHLLRKWLFPANLIAAVEAHHFPDKATAEKDVASVIQLADFLSFYCCNQTSIGKDDFLLAMHNSLPDIQSTWQSCGLDWDVDAVYRWFDWLVNNYDQGCTLKEAFSS